MTESNSTTAPPRQYSNWVLWLIWVAATCAGAAFMDALMYAALVLNRRGIGGILVLVLGWPGIQLLSGAAQHFALRFILPGEERWLRRTLRGAIVAIPVSLVSGFGLAFVAAMLLPMSGHTIDSGGGGMGMGLMIGAVASTAVAQRFVLRSHSRRAECWPIVSILAWTAGMVAAIALAYCGQGTGPIVYAPFALLSWDSLDFGRGMMAYLLMGLLAGGITGAALVYILRAGSPAAIQDAGTIADRAGRPSGDDAFG